MSTKTNIINNPTLPAHGHEKTVQKFADRPLIRAVYGLLVEGAQYTEFELIKALTELDPPFFRVDALKSNLNLFQTHFLLFNSLYLLDKYGREQKVFYIDISALHIQLRTYSDNQSAQVAPSQDSGLASYYLDITNLKTTTADDVENLLNQFWQQYIRHKISTEEEIQASLQYFNYQKIPDRAQLKQDYRKLSNRTHPDKGGNQSEFEQLVQHYQTIKSAITS